MLRKLLIGALGTMAVLFSTTAFAQGTAAEAKAMLEKAVAGVKADKTKALDMFNKGEGGFLDRDLYVFCFNVSDGKLLAVGNPNAKNLIGQDTRTFKDPTGKMYGAENYAAAQKPEGQITETSSYMFPMVGPKKFPMVGPKKRLAPNASFVTKVGDLGCGVGYYAKRPQRR